MNNLVIKVWDTDCPVCHSMRPVEEDAQREFGTEFIPMDLEFAALHPTLFPYISNNIVDENGDVELPIYLFIDDNDNVIGHHTGTGTPGQISPAGDPYS
jgi:thiol-disulfide isomerase/thioredoxin